MATRVRRSGVERRGEIAAAVLDLLGRGGLVAVTSAAIADEIGLSPAALFRHFETLDEIIEAAVDLAVLRLDETLPRPDALPVSRLRALANARVRLFEEVPGIAWLLRSEQASTRLPASAVAKLRRAIGRSRAAIQTALRQGVERGEIRSDVAPRALLAVFTGTIHSLVSQTGLAQKSGIRPDPDDVIPGLFRLLCVASQEIHR